MGAVPVSVVVQSLDGERHLPHVLAALPNGISELIIVDGRSLDAAVEVAMAQWPGVRVIHQSGKGKGNALSRGLMAATGDIIVMLDADGSTDPTEIPRFVAALLTGADFAKGTRFVTGGGSSDITPTRRLGNRFFPVWSTCCGTPTTATSATATTPSGGVISLTCLPIATVMRLRRS